MSDAMESLYPFLYSDTSDLSAVLDQVRASTVAKTAEIGELRRAVADRDGARIAECAREAAARFGAGGRLFAFGNGGSATDAQQLATLFLNPGPIEGRAAPPLPAISLTTDVATVTGIAERAGVAAIFAHQIRYLADPADIALGMSADGNTASVLAGLEAARERGLLTIALAGGDGGQIAASKAADHVLLTPSADPRVVKELQVTAYHVLWELVHVFFEQPGVLGPGVVT